MTFTKTALAAAVMLALTAFSGCGEKKNYSTSDTGSSSSLPSFSAADNADPLESTEPFEGVPQVSSGPLLSLSNTTAAAGGIAEVTLSVSNADLNWNMCGIHITFPEELKCQLIPDSDNNVDCTLGSASAYSTGNVCLLWRENMPEELTSAHKGCLFFTEMFQADSGQDGDIVTFYFHIPDDATSGTVYEFGTYYMSSDIFSNEARDKSMERFAFEHFKSGTVTVE